ncbi:MAG: hypothetical protein SF052_23275 [Bacteroidia bacterium]|nr:hypothetical protein [Bacteroidia bacterium]
MTISPEKIRDEGFRRKFEEKLRQIQAVREKNTFLEYVVNQPLFEELNSLFEENLRLYETCYEVPFFRLEAIRADFANIRKTVHPLRLNKVLKLIQDIETLLSPEDYEVNAQSLEKLDELETHLQKAREEFAAWEKDLEKWRLRLKEVMTLVWAEDYATLKAHYQEVKETLTSEQLPPAFIGPDETQIQNLSQKRSDAFARLKKKAALSKKLLGKVSEAETAFFPLSEFILLEKEAERFIKNRIYRMGFLSVSAAAVIVLGFIFFPGIFHSWRDDYLWKKAVSENSLDTYQDYLIAFPRGKHIVEAYDAMNHIPSGKLKKYTNHVGESFEYEGELTDLKPQGQGIAIFPDGSTYEGHWEMGLRDSFGVWKDTLGGRYEGEWVEGSRQGKGKFVFPDGSIYEGSWRKDEFHGQGTLTYADGSKYSGTWKAGLQEGKGVLYFGEKGSYSGQWSAGKYHNSGTLTDTSGLVYSGQWVNGLREGEGRQTWPDGKEYIGKWKAGAEHGEGVLSWPNGSRFSGVWINGQIDGAGSFVSRFRDEYKGVWKGTADSLVLYDGQGNVFKQGKLEGGLFIGQ